MVRRHHLSLIVLCGLLAFTLGTWAQGTDDQPPLGATNTPPPPPPGAPPAPPGAPKNFWDRWTPEQRQKMQDWMTQKMGTNLSPDTWKQLTPEQREAIHEKMKEFKNEWKEMGGDPSKKPGSPPKGDRRSIPLWDERFPKMIEIAAAPEEKVQALAAQVAAARNESPDKQQEIVAHIMEFRKHLRDEALQAAKNMNIQLTSDKEGDFIRTFWTKRMEIEKSLHQEVEPRRKQMMDQARDELSKQFGGNTNSTAVGAKPPKPSNPLPPPNP